MIRKAIDYLKSKRKVRIDDVIRITLKDLIDIREKSFPSGDSEELLKELEKLYDIRAKEKKSVVKEIALDPNTVILVLGGIAEILLIMNYEKTDAILTKAFSRVIRPRI